MAVNYAAGLSPYADKGVCGLPEVLKGVFLEPPVSGLAKPDPVLQLQS